jgi:hypothetical protein
MDKNESKTAFDAEIDRGVELLLLALRLQSEKDGVDRVVPFKVDKTKVLDSFAMDIARTASNLMLLKKYMPMWLKLGELGRQLMEQEAIHPALGDDLAAFALDYVLKEHGCLK